MNISELLSHPHHMNPGSAARYLESFATAMAPVGHTALTISGYLDSAIHFGGWLEASGLDFANINEQTIRAFGAHRCECPGAARRREFREPAQNVFRGSRIIYGNRVSSLRFRDQRP